MFVLIVGDLPVAAVRFHTQETSEAIQLCIDRFAVLVDYRQNGIGYKVLHSILQKVLATKPVSLVVSVPPESWLQSKLSSFGFVKTAQETNYNGYEQWQGNFGLDGSRSFKAFLTFLSTKASSTL